MAEKLRAIEPIKLKMMDKGEYSFLLSQGAIKKLKQRFEIKTLAELMGKEADEVLPAVFYSAMLDRPPEMSEEQFAEILPSHEEVARALVLLLGYSLPDRPTVEANPTLIQ